MKHEDGYILNISAGNIPMVLAEANKLGLEVDPVNRYAAYVNSESGEQVPVEVIAKVPPLDAAHAIAHAIISLRGGQDDGVHDVRSLEDLARVVEASIEHGGSVGVDGLRDLIATRTRDVLLAGEFGSSFRCTGRRGEILATLLADAGIGAGRDLTDQTQLTDARALLRALERATEPAHDQ